MWKAIFDNVQGTSHRAVNLPCQDACRVLESGDDADIVLIFACSDGAGSAKHAEDGSRIACDAFVHIAQNAIAERPTSLEPFNRDCAVGWCSDVRASLVAKATDLGVLPRELACTFLAGIVCAEHAIFLQIGDGAIVVRNSHGFEPVFWPQSGEFAGTTNFLTDERFDSFVEFSVRRGRIDELAVFTDGLERLILRFADRTVHAPFLEPLLAALREAPNVEQLFSPLREYLDSEGINNRTDDDKTLILATRVTSRGCNAVLES